MYFFIRPLLLICLMLPFTAALAQTISSGWSLSSNHSATPIDVQAHFGTTDAPTAQSSSIISIWAWDDHNGRWLFHSPAQSQSDNAAYAAAHHYGQLQTIAPGQGFWINASQSLDSGLSSQPVGQSILLPRGWSLQGNLSSDRLETAAVFGSADYPSVRSAAVASVWAWDQTNGRWQFYSPQKTPQELQAYANEQGYQVLHHIEPGVGYWINSLAATSLYTGGRQAEPHCAIPPSKKYYVAKNGDDNNPGTEQQPWLTISKAAQTLQAGDTVIIKAGTYQESVEPKNSGQAGQWISYIANPGDSVILDGTDVTLPWGGQWGGLFQIAGDHYINVCGLQVQNSSGAGIYAENAQQLLITRNRTDNTYLSGIYIRDSEQVTVSDNEITEAVNQGTQEMLSIVNTRYFEVSHNHVHHAGGNLQTGGEGIDIKNGSQYGKVFANTVHHARRVCIYVDAWDSATSHIEVFANTVHDCNHQTDVGTGISLASEAGGTLKNIRVFNNVIYNAGLFGILLSNCCDTESSTHPISQIDIINNTVYGHSSTGIYLSNEEAQQVAVRNNIVSQNAQYEIAVRKSAPAAAIEYNLIHGFQNNSWEDVVEVRGTEFIEADPKFINAANQDFRLNTHSPAVDQGTTLSAPAYDFNQIHRSQPDIGAFEVTP